MWLSGAAAQPLSGLEQAPRRRSTCYWGAELPAAQRENACWLKRTWVVAVPVGHQAPHGALLSRHSDERSHPNHLRRQVHRIRLERVQPASANSETDNTNRLIVSPAPTWASSQRFTFRWLRRLPAPPFTTESHRRHREVRHPSTSKWRYTALVPYGLSPRCAAARAAR